jgi:hypothetical protein
VAGGDPYRINGIEIAVHRAEAVRDAVNTGEIPTGAEKRPGAASKSGE